MRPSLTTLTGMTLAAGSIALVGVSLVGAGASSANAEPLHIDSVSTTQVTQIDVAPLDFGPVVNVAFIKPAVDTIDEPAALEPVEVGIDAETEFVNEPGDDYSWIDGDSCPPCGMG